MWLAYKITRHRTSVYRPGDTCMLERQLRYKQKCELHVKRILRLNHSFKTKPGNFPALAGVYRGHMMCRGVGCTCDGIRAQWLNSRRYGWTRSTRLNQRVDMYVVIFDLFVCLIYTRLYICTLNLDLTQNSMHLGQHIHMSAYSTCSTKTQNI